MTQLLIIDLASTTLSPQEKERLQHPRVAGILLFNRNIQDRTQLCQLTESIHHCRPDIFIAIDHEGGFVQRIMRHGFRALPAARTYGEVYDFEPATGLKLAEHYGYIMAVDLIACGIDLSFAPVLDLYHPQSPIIGQLDRAFHQDPTKVSQLTSAFCQGMHRAKMPTTGKHFPGHGSSYTDSHLELPHDDQSLSTLMANDLKPFLELMHNHLLDAVMPAHIVYPQIDATFAAGYSTRWLKDLLRDEWQFDGLVISDCLGMKGADIGDLTVRARQALVAGCDLLITCNQPSHEIDHLLNQLPHIDDVQQSRRFAHFKLQMARYQSGYQTPIIPTSTTRVQSFDPKNPTVAV